MSPPLLPNPISSGHRCSTSQLHPLPTSFTGTGLHPPGLFPHPPPTSLRRLLCAPHRVPASVIVSSIVRPPVAGLSLCPGPYRTLGVIQEGLSVSLVSCLPPYVMCRFLSSSGYWLLWVSILRKEEGPGRLHSLAITRSGPRPPRYMAAPEPSGYPLLSAPFSLPLVVLIPSPLESRLCVALKCSRHCKVCIHRRGFLACKTEGR